jgi:hypothetical protein
MTILPSLPFRACHSPLPEALSCKLHGYHLQQGHIPASIQSPDWFLEPEEYSRSPFEVNKCNKFHKCNKTIRA